MFIKPKKTTFNAPALVYRRFSRIERSRQNAIVYKCEKNVTGTYSWFVFDAELQTFTEILEEDVNAKEIVMVTSNSVIYQSGENYFYWNNTINTTATPINTWVKTQTLPNTYTTLKDAGYSNIGRYQMNAYYFVGQVDYIITGEVAGTKTQPIKGNIMDLQSMNIKYYNDDIIIGEEDLVVVDGALFSAESPDYSIKHMPRPYTIRYVTLNSIL